MTTCSTRWAATSSASASRLSDRPSSSSVTQPTTCVRPALRLVIVRCTRPLRSRSPMTRHRSGASAAELARRGPADRQADEQPGPQQQRRRRGPRAVDQAAADERRQQGEQRGQLELAWGVRQRAAPQARGPDARRGRTPAQSARRTGWPGSRPGFSCRPPSSSTTTPSANAVAAASARTSSRRAIHGVAASAAIEPRSPARRGVSTTGRPSVTDLARNGRHLGHRGWASRRLGLEPCAASAGFLRVRRGQRELADRAEPASRQSVDATEPADSVVADVVTLGR